MSLKTLSVTTILLNSIYLIIFGAFQFDYIHLEDDIVI